LIYKINKKLAKSSLSKKTHHRPSYMSSRQLIKKTSLDALDIKDESKGDAHQHF